MDTRSQPTPEDIPAGKPGSVSNAAPGAESSRLVSRDDRLVADIEQNSSTQSGSAIRTTASGGAAKPATAPRQNPGHLRTKEDSYEHYDDDHPKKRHKFLRFMGWMLLIVVLTGVLGGAGWYFVLRTQPKDTPSTSQQQPQTSAASQGHDNPPAGADLLTETFNSSAFGLQFDYPDNWKASEGSDNKVVATSPATKMKLAGGGTQIGQITLTVQHKQISLPEFKTGNALAVRESKKINYKKPSQVQRASTYLSFLSYDGSVSKGIDGVYVTGDAGYVQNQYIPQDDVIKADPLITVTFRACKDDACKTIGDPMTLATSAWDDTNTTSIIEAMLESIVVQ